MLRRRARRLAIRFGFVALILVASFGAYTAGSALTGAAEGEVPGGVIQEAETEGFDSCGTLGDTEMNAWAESSPFTYIGFYLGGRNNGECFNPNKEWIQHRYAAHGKTQGWDFAPLWVGRQSQCTAAGAYYDFSNTIETAQKEAAEEVDLAVQHAENIGFGPGAVIYYDIEPWNIENSTCMAAFKAFLNVWSKRLQEKQNFKAGVYAGDCEGIQQLHGVSYPPDDVWMAHYWPKGTPRMESVYTVNCVSSSNWEVHRFHQWDGPYPGEESRGYRTWGGYRLAVDTSCAKGVDDGKWPDGDQTRCQAK
jgi:hypothetical protein